MRGVYLAAILALGGVGQAGLAAEPLFHLPPRFLESRFRFSPDGRWLAQTIGIQRIGNQRNPIASGKILVWEVASRRLVASVDTQDHVTGPVNWSHDGQWLVTGGADRRCLLWKVNAQPTPKVPLLSTHTAYVHYQRPSGTIWHGTITEVCFSPTVPEFASVSDGTYYLGSTNRQQSLKIWRYLGTGDSPRRGVRSGEQPAPLSSASRGSTSGGLRGSSNAGSSAEADPDAPRLTVQLPSTPRRAAYAADGKSIGIGFSGRTGVAIQPQNPEVHLYDVETGERTQQWDVSGVADLGEKCLDVLTFSPDGKYLAAGAMNVAVVWDIATKREVWRLVGSSEWTDAVFAPDSRLLALSDSVDGFIRLLQVPEFTEVSRGRLPKKAIRLMEFTPDGKSLLTGSGDSSMRLWDVEDLLARKQWGWEKQPQ